MQNKIISKQSTLLQLSLIAVVVLFVLGVAGLFQALATADADATQSVPYRINYQGRISDNQGSILPDGTYNVTFRFFEAATGGSPIWTEVRTNGNRVQVTNGLFNIQIFMNLANKKPETAAETKGDIDGKPVRKRIRV